MRINGVVVLLLISLSAIQGRPLEKLRLADNHLCTSRAGKAIQEILKQKTAITELDLKNNYNQYFASSGSGFAAELALGLIANTKLTKLDVSENMIGAEGTRKVVEALKENRTMTELNVAGNRFAQYHQMSGIEALIETGSSWPSLKSIDLAGNYVPETQQRQVDRVFGREVVRWQSKEAADTQ